MKFLSPPLSRLTCALALGALPAWAQTNPPVQKVTGPNARYWVSAEVSSGLSMASMQSGGGIASMMAAAMGGSGPRKSLRLELGSVRAANPAEATHAIPTALGMGASLPLLGERAAAATPEPVERDIPDTREMGDKPKGRMLFFWGCGESAGPGQPVILDFAQLANGVVPPNMRSVAIRAQRSGPALGRDRGFAEWPNRKDSTGVPAQASLVGEHRVSGGFVPDIRFQVGAAHDFMDALSMQQAPSPGGGHRLAWNPVRTALGYFANGMGFKQGEGDGGDIVFWNSSSARLSSGGSSSATRQKAFTAGCSAWKPPSYTAAPCSAAKSSECSPSTSSRSSAGENSCSVGVASTRWKPRRKCSAPAATAPRMCQSASARA
jgi:hypothetical protein